jgi:hypothetical protein
VIDRFGHHTHVKAILETGRTHQIRVKLRMIAFWSKLVLNENKLSSVLYRLMYLLKTKHQYSFKWVNSSQCKNPF